MKSFHKFPPREKAELFQKWITAIKRDEGEEFQVTEHTVVCSDHFLDSSFSGDIPPRTAEERLQKAGRRHTYRLKENTVPFYSRDAIEKATQARPPPKPRREVPPPKKRVKRLTETEQKILDLEHSVGQLTEELSAVKDHEAEAIEELKMKSAGQFSYDHLRSVGGEATSSSKSMFEFYTGLSVQAFDSLWIFLDAKEDHVLSLRRSSSSSAGAEGHTRGQRSTLSMHDQLVMVLMRLRLGLLEKDLAFRFGVSASSVSRIFVKWINFVYLRLGSLPIWPTWESVRETMPACFKESYPSTFIIIDATELQVEIPASLSLQSQNYSQYKAHTTHKCLLGIAPNGCITFVSELFTGSISDRNITIQSGILDLLKSVPPGKSVMADRGFEIQDLLLQAGLILNIPPFKGASGVLSTGDVIRTQQIARVRIHVERVIGQVKKTFRIFRGAIPMSLEGSINQMWTVCCLLTNFKGPIVVSS